MVKNPPASAGDMGSISESGGFPGEGNGSPLQYSCLGNPMYRETWWATVHKLQRIGHDSGTKQQQQNYVLDICLFVHTHTHTQSDNSITVLSKSSPSPESLRRETI